MNDEEGDDLPSAMQAFPDIIAGVLGVIILLWVIVKNTGTANFAEQTPHMIELNYKDSDNVESAILFLTLDGKTYNNKDDNGLDYLEWKVDTRKKTIIASIFDGDIDKVGVAIDEFDAAPSALAPGISVNISIVGRKTQDFEIVLPKNNGYRDAKSIH